MNDVHVKFGANDVKFNDADGFDVDYNMLISWNDASLFCSLFCKKSRDYTQTQQYTKNQLYNGSMVYKGGGLSSWGGLSSGTYR